MLLEHRKAAIVRAALAWYRRPGEKTLSKLRTLLRGLDNHERKRAAVTEAFARRNAEWSRRRDRGESMVAIARNAGVTSAAVAAGIRRALGVRRSDRMPPARSARNSTKRSRLHSR